MENTDIFLNFTIAEKIENPIDPGLNFDHEWSGVIFRL